MVEWICSYQYNTYIKDVYNEYRLVQATYQIMYNDSTCKDLEGRCIPFIGDSEFNQTNITFHCGWLRSSTYAAPPAFTNAHFNYDPIGLINIV